MITIKDYAKSRNITYEAVRKQVVRYATELDGHTTKENRTTYLDDYAVEFLDNKRNSNPIVILETSKDEEIERLQNENKALLLKITSLQEELNHEKDFSKGLLLEKTEWLQEKTELLLEQKNQVAVEPEPKKKWWKLFN